MPLVASAMAAAMLARAVAQGLIDQPPEFALSRTYLSIAQGIVTTFQAAATAFGTINYGPGQPAIPVGVIVPTVGLDDLDPERFWPVAQALSGYFGPFSIPFFFGLGGIIEYLQANITISGVSPTATGSATLLPGGVFFDPAASLTGMHAAAALQQLMVVQLGVHTQDPLIPAQDPITGEDLFVGSLFTRAAILLGAVSDAMVLELAFGNNLALPVAGAFNPLDPPISVTAPLGRFA